MKSFLFQGPDAPRELRMERSPDGWRCREGDAEVSLEIMAGDGERGYLRLGERMEPFAVLRRGRTTLVHLGGRVYTLEEAGRTGVGAGHSAEAQVRSQMPGKILELKVKVGAEVAEGQALLVMESMKMELTVAAPRAGRIGAIHCQVGQMVDMGALLVEWEEDDGDTQAG